MKTFLPLPAIPVKAIDVSSEPYVVFSHNRLLIIYLWVGDKV